MKPHFGEKRVIETGNTPVWGVSSRFGSISRPVRALGPDPPGGRNRAGRVAEWVAAPVIVCLGEALVDLICERPVARSPTPTRSRLISAARSPTSRSPLAARGGRRARRRRRGRRVGALAGRAARARGRGPALLRAARRRADAGRVRDLRRRARAEFQIYGDAIELAVASVAPRLDAAIEAATALVYSSTTLATDGRARGHAARPRARAGAAHGLLRPQHPPEPWGGDARAAAEASRELIAGSFLVRANRGEATAIAGVDDPRAGRGGARRARAELAVVTLGAEGR